MLAEIAVHQTRAHFLARDGHLVDNPRVGPDLAERYWRPGNAAGASTTRSASALTGRALNADAIAADVNLDAPAAIAAARASLAKLPSIPRHEGPWRST
ncbi:MAG: hypothetical protein U0325_18305 [Polyangiales bacterium]